MIISISGKPGSGKSTVAKKLATALGYRHYYMGGIRRQAAKEKGMTLEEFNRYGEQTIETDKLVDDLMVELGKNEDNFIVEGRTAFHFLPQSVKIFLDVDEKEGAKRIFSDLKNNLARNEARRLHSTEDVLAANRQRMKSDDLRYRKYYNIDLFDLKNYDFVLDSTKLSIEEEFKAVLKFVKSRIG